MEKISSLFNFPKSKAGSERAVLIEFFIERLYPGWLGFKKLKDSPKNKQNFVKYFCIKTSLFKLQDLYYIKSSGLDYESRGGDFGKYVFGAIKPKK